MRDLYQQENDRRRRQKGGESRETARWKNLLLCNWLLKILEEIQPCKYHPALEALIQSKISPIYDGIQKIYQPT
eukprot:15332190-Ditylum_brightwellii.AAC.1